MKNTYKKTLKELTLIKKLIPWINATYIGASSSDLIYTNDYLSLVENMILNHGVHEGLTRIKTVRLHITRYLSGAPILKKDESTRFSINRIGLPRKLRSFQTLITQENLTNEQLQLIMTILGLTRALSGGHKKPDLSSITDKSPFMMTKSLEKEIIKEMKQIVPRPKPLPEWEDFHKSLKKGPNGQAMLSSIEDAHLIVREHKILLQHFEILNKNTKLTSAIHYCNDHVDLAK